MKNQVLWLHSSSGSRILFLLFSCRLAIEHKQIIPTGIWKVLPLILCKHFRLIAVTSGQGRNALDVNESKKEVIPAVISVTPETSMNERWSSCMEYEMRDE